MDIMERQLDLKIHVKTKKIVLKWYVLHAEANAIMKVAASTQSSKDATLYVTMSPCRECSKLIFQSGIKRVVYNIEYKDKTGIDFLKKAGIEVIHIPKI